MRQVRAKLRRGAPRGDGAGFVALLQLSISELKLHQAIARIEFDCLAIAGFRLRVLLAQQVNPPQQKLAFRQVGIQFKRAEQLRFGLGVQIGVVAQHRLAEH